jgi:hypothetical protein
MRENEVYPRQANDVNTPLNEEDWYTKKKIDKVKNDSHKRAGKYYKKFRLAKLFLLNPNEEELFKLHLARYIILKEGHEINSCLNDPELDASFNSDHMFELDEQNFVQTKAAEQFKIEIDERGKRIDGFKYKIESIANQFSNIFLTRDKQSHEEIMRKVASVATLLRK